MVGTAQRGGNHRGRSYPGTEGEETSKVCETAVPAESCHHVRYRFLYAQRETDMRGCVKQEGLAGMNEYLKSL